MMGDNYKNSSEIGDDEQYNLFLTAQKNLHISSTQIATVNSQFWNI